MSVFDAAQRAALYTPEFADRVAPSAAEAVLLGPWGEASGAALLDQLLEIDATVYLPGDLLAKIDIATMAFSLEARSPLLDHELMELAASIPPAYKANGMQRKIALRGALRGWVPDASSTAPSRGSSCRWRAGCGASWRRSRAKSCSTGRAPSAAGRARRRSRRCSTSTATAGADHGRGLWALLALELWAQSVAAPQPQPEAIAA